MFLTMASLRSLVSLAGLTVVCHAFSENFLVSEHGQKAAIPGWDLQSSSEINETPKSLSNAGADTSSWYHIPIPRCTLMACLLEIGLYEDEDLWYSDNLRHFNRGQFTEPWVYRHEFSLKPREGSHYILETNGITSRGDIYLNGQLVADKYYQSGSYSGHEYDVTDMIRESNALLIQTYPTDYYRDLALGFIDWNPVPPDNGTGIWREVTLKQTGAVSLGPIEALVNIDPGQVSLRVTAKNLENKVVKVSAEALITEPDHGADHIIRTTVTLEPRESKTIEFNKTFDNPRIWWPKAWGQQPLYSVEITAFTECNVSDKVKGTFGLRTVTSEVNSDDDILFTVNDHPFQVLGSGYSADMFLRVDEKRFESIVRYMLDIGLNTIRLEGKNEHPELYEIADRYGLMVIAGWECCNKWESWKYNEELQIGTPDYWDDADYSDANATMWHEALMMQKHPSMLAFLIGSDFWPDDRATKIYVDAMRGASWQIPIVGSASKRGYPDLLGPGGMKMEGPYDWVPPNYWYNTEPADERYGAAFGFGSELGPGVGTPEIGSLKRFLSDEDMSDLWKKPDKGLYHMSTNISSFYDRKIYNEGLYKRYGEPTSLEDYLRKAQIMDYEAIRAEFEGYSSRWNTGRRATGLVYWMLNNAWPSLHWNQFDNYLHPAGSYFGSKTGARLEHVSYNYQDQDIWLINHSVNRSGARQVEVEIIKLDGTPLHTKTLAVNTTANVASRIATLPDFGEIDEVVFLRLILSDDDDVILSRNVYWIAPEVDKLDWDNSTWYHTPVTKFSDYTALFAMKEADVEVTTADEGGIRTVKVENHSPIPAFFLRLNLVDAAGGDVNPVIWSDNYLTLWPEERLVLNVDDFGAGGTAIRIDGTNVMNQEVSF